MTGFWERDDERFERIVAEVAACNMSNHAYSDATFAQWLERSAVRRLSDMQRTQLEREAEQFASAMSRRVMAIRLAKKYPRYALRERCADVSGTFSQTIELAVRVRCAPRVDLRVAAGVGRELWDEACDAWVELPAEVPRGRYVALTVAGDSMTPLLHDGDVILVNPRGRATRESIIVARRPDDGYVVKHVARVGRTELELASLNPAYAPFLINRDPVNIVGTVIARLAEGSATEVSVCETVVPVVNSPMESA